MAKLVEILAEEMEEWPKGVTHLTQSAVDREIYNAQDGKDTGSLESLEPRFDAIKSHDERGKYPIVTRAQWQAERDRQKGGEWKRHRGGKCPVHGDQQVEVKFRDGAIEQSHASDFFGWKHREIEDPDAHIMQYRIISQPQAEEVEVKKFCMGANCNATAESIVHSHECEAEHEASYVGVWAQSTGPLAWRDTIIHCQAIIEDCEREIERNVSLLDSEGLFMQLNAKKGMQAYDVPVAIPCSDWQIGDILEVVAQKGANSHEFEIGEHVRIDGFDLDDDNLPVKCYALDDSDFWYLKYEEAKFIRRP